MQTHTHTHTYVQECTRMYINLHEDVIHDLTPLKSALSTLPASSRKFLAACQHQKYVGYAKEALFLRIFVRIQHRRYLDYIEMNFLRPVSIENM